MNNYTTNSEEHGPIFFWCFIIIIIYKLIVFVAAFCSYRLVCGVLT